MRYTRFIMLLAAVTLAGCNGAVATSRDGRGIVGQSAWFSAAKLQEGTQSTAVTLGGKTVHVAASQVTWDDGGSLTLPAQWRELRLDESSGSILVTVDGARLARIYPKA